MTPDEYQLWDEGNAGLRVMFRASSPCRDCTPLFHADMVAGGMCDGLPLTEGQREPSLKYSTYDELKAVRRTYPKYGAPSGLSEALYRARMREYRRRRRAGIAV